MSTCAVAMAVLSLSRAVTCRSAQKEIKNDLEDSKNRGSSGGDGNQHVRLRGPQIGSCDNYRIRRRWTVVATMCPKTDDGNLSKTAICGRLQFAVHLRARGHRLPRVSSFVCASLRPFSCLVLHSLAGGAFLSLLFPIFADSDNKVAASHRSDSCSWLTVR
jgi:hypothetical protein